MFFIVFLLISGVESVYFTMTDMTVTIPTDKSKFPPKNHPLATLSADGDATKRYWVENHENYKFLKVFPTTGDVLFTQEFLEYDITNLDEISTSLLVEDSIGQKNRTSLLVKLFPMKGPLDCSRILEDLCYWKTVHYRIKEDAKPTLIGSLASPYLSEMCSSYRINYTLLTEKNNFQIVSSSNSWSIQTLRPLDRDVPNANISIMVQCLVESPEHSVWNDTKEIQVRILDVDDNPPMAQEQIINVGIPSKVVRKDQIVQHTHLIFHDKDSPEVNNYDAAILQDHLGILSPQCNKFRNDRNGEPQTAIHCKLKFTRDLLFSNWTYEVLLQLNDTSLINGSKVVQIPVRLHFRNESGYHPEMVRRELKPPIMYPQNKVKVFRTAAPLARITQPESKEKKNAKSFALETEPTTRDIFNVTVDGGILFVHDIVQLRKAPEFFKLNITWVKNGKREQDELEIRIVDEPEKTCVKNGPSIHHDWSFCSEYETPEECTSSDSCAIATGGSYEVEQMSHGGEKGRHSQRCFWRGDPNPSKSQVTHFYATCTPDRTFCPDGICDPLESLHELICPQDCARNILVPAIRNPKTNRGIDKAAGVCSCSEINCSCNPMKKKRRVDSESKIYTTPPGNTSDVGTLNLKNTAGFGSQLAYCGTSCVLGIVAGALFLGGAAALIVICWRLDRVHKAVRNKFSDDSQELAAPLSDYVGRNMEPLALNFDMTTSLADNAVLNIIKKHASDPKWEFPRSQLIIEQTLGEGEFGRVLRAKALNIAGQSGHTTVAVKTLKDDARETELNDLLSEYQLLKEVSHPNVIRLLGVCTAPGGPIYLIIEFAEHGSLRNYLRRSRHLKSECGRLPTSAVDEAEVHYDQPNISQITPKEIISFAWQICKGMAYLSEIKLVHRDLAARNVLLGTDKVCKISDFGLTRDIYEDDAYFKRSKGRVPVKWMAPESLSDHIYTNKSDVWSFGILVWELITLGATPYPGIAVQNLFHLLKQGYRMERPDNCSPSLYNIMRSCWHVDPEHRPTFQELASVFEKMLSDQVEYLDLTNNAIHNRSYFCSPFEESDDKSEINPLNYLSKSQSYLKCGSTDKFQGASNFLKEQDTNQNDVNTQGYETPIRIPRKIQTPTNDCPQYYTDMDAGKKN